MADQVQGVLAPPTPSAPAQAEQHAQQQQQDYPAPPAQQQGQQIVHLNWSNFKPEFSVKPDEDVEAHLLCNNDWVTAYHFVEGVKVQRFCLTLLGEARFWYHSLEPINVDWQGLQNLFRQQYSRIGNYKRTIVSCMEIF